MSLPPAFNPAYPDRNVRTETVYDAEGDAIAAIDNAGVITRMYYDSLHRPVTVVQNLTGQGVEVTTPPAFNPAFPDQNVRTDTVYGDGGEVARTLDTLGRALVSCYDGQGRVTKNIQNPSVTSPCGAYTPSSQTDLDIITLTTYDGVGNRTSLTDPNGFETIYQYDSIYRLLSEADPLGHTTSYGCSLAGARVSVTDAEGVVTRFEFDALSRLTAVVQNHAPGSPADHETNVRTEYTYDAAGYRLAILDGNGNTTAFTYDALGRLKTESDALAHTWTYGYDAAGNRTSLLDAEGFTTTFAYDGLHRLVAIDYPAPDADVTYTYDAAGDRVGMADGAGTTQWVYDDLHRPTSVTDPFAGVAAYTYDGLGARLSLTYPDARVASYLYDAAGRLQQVTDWDSGTTSYSYDRGGRPSTVSLPDGIGAAYGFDAGGRLTTLRHARGVQLISSFAYSYDSVGNRQSAAEWLMRPLPASDLIFADGLESGDFSAWSGATTDGGDLSVTAAAAIAGNWGIQALLDDNNPVYVTDQSPEANVRYRARFYFDPNSVSMASGNAHYIFQGMTGTSTSVVRLELRSYQGDYQVRASLVNDSTSWTLGTWLPIRDQMHFMELDWRAASGAGTQDGGLTLWIDGAVRSEIAGIDNDTRRVDFVRLGAVSGIDTGTRGTYFFDAFESRSATYIGADLDAPEPPPPPALPDDIFGDGFESGGFDAWSTSTTDGGDLSVTAAAAIVGDNGMQAVLDDNASIYVTDWSPFEEGRYRARFYFDPNSVVMASGNAHYLLYALNTAGTVVARIEFRYYSAAYQVRAALRADSGAYTSTAWVTISDASHCLEIDWRAATGPAANNGRLSFWVDGTLRDERTGIDNDTLRVDLVRLGAVAGVDTGTRGTTHFDEFESRRQTYIGPVDGEMSLLGGETQVGASQVSTSEPLVSGLPLAFVANAGQTHRDVQFVVHGFGGDTLFFTQQGVVLVLPPSPQSEIGAFASEDDPSRDVIAPERPVVRVRFEGADSTPRIVGADPLPGLVNYFLGNDPSAWQTNLPTYRTIIYEGLYPGIDLRFEGGFGALKGTFLVAPGADPTAIRWHYPGAGATALSPYAGDLQIDLAPAACQARGDEDACAVFERSPMAWQEINGERLSVSVSFTLHADGTIGFAVGRYSRAHALVIDPTLSYSTYLGGTGFEQANDVAVDASGQFLITGITLSSDFPTMDPLQPVIGGSYDAFVTRLNAAGDTLLYSTYLGGSNHDEAGGIAIDASGHAYVSGHTSSADFPVASALQPLFAGDWDAFVLKLTPTGDALVYSTYLGGSHTDRNVEIAITASGEATIAGSTWSPNFPTHLAIDPTIGGVPDAFVARLNASGSALVFSTYYGGNSHDEGFGVAVDSEGHTVITGKTHSTDLPVVNAAQSVCTPPLPCHDAFVARLNPPGTALVFSTYLGGAAGDDGQGIAVDAGGTVYVTGRTWSTDFPTQSPIQPNFQGGARDAFVVMYSPDGTRGFGTYYGGTGRDDPLAITVDGERSIYFVGATNSTDFPTVLAVQSTYGGGDDDAFAVRLFPDGTSVAYSTFLGGNASDVAFAIDMHGNNNAYIAGSSRSTDLPLVSPYQAANRGSCDVYIARITDDTPPHEESRNISYTYDPLYRLTGADYSDGSYFHYTYDAVGNRLTEVTVSGTTAYTYDSANRLLTVGGVPYTWSDNGNLLGDGTYTYAYDHADRLISATWGTRTHTLAYNGLGDRMRQTVDGAPTNYSLDLAAGLTQVLSAGGTAYLYGNGRIGEEQPGGWAYHLPDALGSLRQLADASADITLARTYEPFGDPLSTVGTGTSIYGFTSEQRDGTGLVYLRARYYGPSFGRFLSRDSWDGDPNQPMSYNAWLYVHANPTNWTDPTGRQPCEEGECFDPLEYYNLTGWLARTMRANAGSAEVIRIRTFNRLARPLLETAFPVGTEVLEELVDQWRRGGLDVDCLRQTIQGSLRSADPYKAQAVDAFIGLVAPDARWDFKEQMRVLLEGDSVRFCGQTRGRVCMWLHRDVPGNVHFGYIGRAAGFLPAELHWGAGLYQLLGDARAYGRPWSYGDDPRDAAAVDLGIRLFEYAGTGTLSPAMVGNSLLVHRSSLHSSGPVTSPHVEHPYPQDQWGTQYPIGFFDTPGSR